MRIEGPARLALLLFLYVSGTASFAASEADIGRVLADESSLPAVKLDRMDLDRLSAEDAVRDELPVPKRFAVGHDVRVTPSTHGRWQQLADGRWQWRHAVRSPDAVHLNFGFAKFVLPDGAKLTIVSPDSRDALGPWGAEENKPHGQFWTPVLFGNSAVIELVVPAEGRDAVGLELVRIGQGYRGFGVLSKACKAGACNTDVACLSADDPWNGPRRAVGAYTRGATDVCTGSLLNNTSGDRRMLFATATHCGNSAANVASVVVYWNYESPTCRAPGSSQSGQVIPRPTDPVNITNGNALIASTLNPFTGSAGPRSDFTLLELDPADPTPQPNLFWAGWDRRLGSTNEPPGSTTATWPCAPGTAQNPTQGLCASIHHPGVDEKRITFVNTPLTIGNISSGVNVHWRGNWIVTPPLPNIPGPAPTVVSVTEPGSSGSPLYNADKRLVGVLSGGPSACGNNQYWDFYGALFHAWEGGGTAATRMRDHLDPAGTAPFFIDGINRCTPPAVPPTVTATAPAANTVSVAFDTAGGGDRFRVYRAIGTCPGAQYTFLGEATTSPYVDTTVSGGTSYAYRVSAFGDADSCESTQSTCSSVAATGLCTRAPDFAGLASAASAGTPRCGVQLDWGAAASTCAPAGTVRYNVYASTDPNFTPGPANLVASCVTDPNWTDTNFLDAETRHYVVRVEDSGGSGSGACAMGLTDANLVRRSATPSGPAVIAFADAVDPVTSPPLWTTAGSTGTAGANWAVVSDPLGAAGNSAWFVVDADAVTDRRLATVSALEVPAGGAELNIRHRYSTEASWDGGVLEYSLDGGTTWTDILAAQGGVAANPNRFITGGYASGTLNTSGNPLGGRAAWQGDSAGFASAWLNTRVNLADFAGRSVQLRFRFGSDGSVDGPGWWIDAVEVSRQTSCDGLDTVFRNGFE